MIVGDREVPPNAYSRSGRSGYPRLLVSEMTALIRGGAMLAIDAIDELEVSISSLCRALEMHLGLPVDAELYATCLDGDVRPPSWNDHETLLLQIGRAKQWSLFQPTEYYPVGGGWILWHRRTSRDGLAKTSEPGTCCIFRAAGGTRSGSAGAILVFLVVSFSNPRGVDVIMRVLEKLSDKEIIRTDIPRFCWPTIRVAL